MTFKKIRRHLIKAEKHIEKLIAIGRSDDAAKVFGVEQADIDTAVKRLENCFTDLHSIHKEIEGIGARSTSDEVTSFIGDKE